MLEDRKRQVETTRARYGADHYKKIGLMGAQFGDKNKARLASLKRWHPDWFDENGELMEKHRANND